MFAIGALLVIIAFILILIALFSPKEQPVEDTITSTNFPTPTTYSLFRNPFTQKKIPSPTPTKTLLQAKEINEQQAKTSFEQVKKIVSPPHTEGDFRAFYSAQLNKIVIDQQSSRSTSSVETWLRNNKSEHLLQSNRIIFYNSAAKRNLSAEQTVKLEALKTALKTTPISVANFKLFYEEEHDLVILEISPEIEKLPADELEKVIAIFAQENNIDTEIISNSDLTIRSFSSQQQTYGLSNFEEVYRNTQQVEQSTANNSNGEDKQTSSSSANSNNSTKDTIENTTSKLTNLLFVFTIPTTPPSRYTPPPSQNPTSSPNNPVSPSPNSEISSDPSISLPPVNSDNGSIITQASRIIPQLRTGLWDYYNRLTTQISGNGYQTPYREGRSKGTGRNGLFWCTNLVISSYRLAGHIDLKEGPMESVTYMRQWWQQKGGKYVHIPGNNLTALQKIKPGCAFFFEYNNQHTGLVKSVNWMGNNNGKLIIYESNSSKTESQFTIRDGVVRDTYGMTLTGFGCVN